jgi:hypothetical protein
MSLKNPVKPPGIDPGTVRLVAQRLNHYATQSPQRQVTREMCKEICSEANTAHAFEFTAALSELQDFVPATARSLFHKFNHNTPCATNAALPLSPRYDDFRIIYWIVPAI